MSFHHSDIVAADQLPNLNPAMQRAMTALTKPNAVLALARGLDTAIVVAEDSQGNLQKSAAVDLAVTIGLADMGLIKPDDPTLKVVRYSMTARGQNLMSQASVVETPNAAAQVKPSVPEKSTRPDTVLATLARRLDKNGDPFLSKKQIKAGERLKENYEVARLSQDFPNDILADIRCQNPDQTSDLKRRLTNALVAVGPGLADILVGCCCETEGLEDFETRQGWSARSGKIVLRIALQRLVVHYDTCPEDDAMIG